ncbi:MAG: DUF3301 domain-containing protein [Gammaproteobacteria bacterium]
MTGGYLGTILLVLVAGLWLWHSSMAAREKANEAAAEACRRLQLELLDGTVALSRLWPRRDERGQLALERTYAFEYSDDGQRRLEGFVLMLGRRVTSVGLASARLTVDAEPPPPG